FSLTLLRPPRSSLFPYTTLFRSCNLIRSDSPLARDAHLQSRQHHLVPLSLSRDSGCLSPLCVHLSSTTTAGGSAVPAAGRGYAGLHQRGRDPAWTHFRLDRIWYFHFCRIAWIAEKNRALAHRHGAEFAARTYLAHAAHHPTGHTPHRISTGRAHDRTVGRSVRYRNGERNLWVDASTLPPGPNERKAIDGSRVRTNPFHPCPAM